MNRLFLAILGLTAALALPACDRAQQPASEEHGHEPAGHAQEQGHGHGDGPTVAVTHFTDKTELFVEFPPLAVGSESPFAAHLTRLDNFKPVAEGRITVTLSGGGVPEERFTVDAPSIPGIFRPVAKPRHAAQRHVLVTLEAPGLNVTHDLGAYTVHPDAAAAAKAHVEEEEEGGAISYLKEQQWQVDFATAPATVRTLRAALNATGTVRARADGEAFVNAPTAGHVRTARGNFPYAGMPVKAGQVLATVAPRLGGATDIATLELDVERARSSHELARHELERLEPLLAQEAIAAHRVIDARNRERIAAAELATAQKRLQQYRGQAGGAVHGVPVRAPLGGLIAQAHVASGSFADEGQPLFHIVALDKLWLEARIAEADLGRLRKPTGAWFTIGGFDEPFDTRDLGGRLISLGGAVDPASRTVPAIFEFANPGQRLRAGMHARVNVLTGETREAVAIPQAAVVDDGGQPVVYVMLGGESFARRMVQLGIRDGEYVEITQGVKAGERVVTRGAYLVRLASTSPAEAGHGHAH